MESCYSSQVLLCLGQDTILSCCGVQQGDPLSPLGFALSLHPIVECIRSEVPDLALNAWYLDDGTLEGSPEDLMTALGIIERDGPSVGLHLNRSKSLLFIPEDVDASQSPLPSDIPISRCGFTLLSSPIGPPSYCEEVFKSRVAKVRLSLEALQDMGDSQLESTLLCSCLALPKVSFVLRTCPLSHICDAVQEFDQSIRNALETISGGPMSDWSWLKASLPSSCGGFGLRSAHLHAPAIYITSSSSSKQLVESMLGLAPAPSSHVCSTVAALAVAAASQNGPTWIMLMFPYVNVSFHMLLMRLSTSAFSPLPLPLAPEL